MVGMVMLMDGLGKMDNFREIKTMLEGARANCPRSQGLGEAIDGLRDPTIAINPSGGVFILELDYHHKDGHVMLTHQSPTTKEKYRKFDNLVITDNEFDELKRGTTEYPFTRYKILNRIVLEQEKSATQKEHDREHHNAVVGPFWTALSGAVVGTVLGALLLILFQKNFPSEDFLKLKESVDLLNNEVRILRQIEAAQYDLHDAEFLIFLLSEPTWHIDLSPSHVRTIEE